MIGRYGGEEFIVALPNCTLENARRSMEAVCQQMSKIEFTGAEGAFSVTLSIGMASLADYEKSEDAIEAADKALYGRKAAGRNGVTSINDLDWDQKESEPG